MSTYFDVACLDCRSQMGVSDARKEAPLKAVIENRETLTAISQEFDVEVRIDFLYLNLDWLRHHKDHKLSVKCEYETFEELEERARTGLSYEDYRKTSALGGSE